MARNKLSEAKVRSLDKVGVHSDGDGLYIKVRPSNADGSPGSRQWVFIYRRGPSRIEIGLGGYGQGTAPVSLALARKKADAIRDMLARGEDPRPGAAAPVVTFKDVMASTIAVKLANFRNEKHQAQWRMTLDKYAAPLHDMPVADINRNDILSVLEPIWTTIPETADRLRQRIAAVIDHAKARDLYQGDNPADWRGGLKELLPERARLTRGHHAAVPYAVLPVAVKAIVRVDAVSARCLEFVALTAARSGEARNATWSEIDMNQAVWTVPSDRMKAGKEHRVPLTPRALVILEQQRRLATCDLVFGGGAGGRPISDTAMVKLLRRVSGDDTATLHGFRSSFRDWAGDETGHPREVIEAALAHQLKDKTEAAYRRSDALAKRRELMEAWAAYLAG